MPRSYPWPPRATPAVSALRRAPFSNFGEDCRGRARYLFVLRFKEWVYFEGEVLKEASDVSLLVGGIHERCIFYHKTHSSFLQKSWHRYHWVDYCQKGIFFLEDFIILFHLGRIKSLVMGDQKQTVFVRIMIHDIFNTSVLRPPTSAHGQVLHEKCFYFWSPSLSCVFKGKQSLFQTRDFIIIQVVHRNSENSRWNSEYDSKLLWKKKWQKHYDLKLTKASLKSAKLIKRLP